MMADDIESVRRRLQEGPRRAAQAPERMKGAGRRAATAWKPVVLYGALLAAGTVEAKGVTRCTGCR